MEILHTHPDFVVIIKPVGLDSETDVPAHLSQSMPGDFYTLHRLDKNVGGVMIYARNKPAAAALSKAIQAGSMVKEYVALVHGTPPESGDWTDLLLKDSRKNKVFVVSRMRGGVKEARLAYTLLRTENDKSLVRIRLYTGRSHQIRAQFSSRGYPLVGDHKYGSRDAAQAPFLFSCCITFPYKGETLSFSALPEWAK